jgi:hypothetical protein
MGLLLAFLGALFPLVVGGLVIGGIVWPFVAELIESVEQRVAD